MAKRHSSLKPKHQTWRFIITGLILLISGIFLWPQIQVIQSDWSKVTEVDLSKVGLSWLFICLANIPAAFVYWSLTSRKLPIMPTIIAQFATGLSNRLLPAGMGAIGLNTLYISKKIGTSKAEAASLAAANNLIGFIGFLAVLLFSFSISTNQKPQLFIPTVSRTGIFTVISILTVVGIIGVITRQSAFGKRVRKTLNILYATLVSLVRDPWRFISALFFSTLITVCYLMAFLMALQASGASIDFTQLILVFAAGNIALSATPTPGGVGGTELVLASALQLAGVTTGSALIISISYRIASFWLPIIPGILAAYYLKRTRSI